MSADRQTKPATSFAQRAIRFYRFLKWTGMLPPETEAMNPYLSHEVMSLVEDFFESFYADNHKRIALLGINPGRFGAGLTGLTFTDPVFLEEACGISNRLEKKHELSSRFVYDVIGAFGGAERFFSGFFMSAVCPLGFVARGKNMNYYDSKELLETSLPFIRETLSIQMELGLYREVCLCLGEGKNHRIFSELNKKEAWFEEIVPLPHPRFVMQYRYSRKDSYKSIYLEAFDRALSLVQRG